MAGTSPFSSRPPQVAATETAGIVIRAFPSGEADLIIRLVTPLSGKISCIAKGTRKERKKSTHLDLFDFGTFEVHHGRSSLPRLRAMTKSHPWKRLREDLHRLSCACLICECYDALLIDGSHDDDRSAFEALHATLQDINDLPSIRDLLRTTHDGLVHLLNITGYLDESWSAPSRNNLRLVLQQIERCSEKKLRCDIAVLELIKGIAA